MLVFIHLIYKIGQSIWIFRHHVYPSHKMDESLPFISHTLETNQNLKDKYCQLIIKQFDWKLVYLADVRSFGDNQKLLTNNWSCGRKNNKLSAQLFNSLSLLNFFSVLYFFFIQRKQMRKCDEEKWTKKKKFRIEDRNGQTIELRWGEIMKNE